MSQSERRRARRDTARTSTFLCGIRREPVAHDKQSHRLAPQACVLWVPVMRGYLESFSPSAFRVVELPGLARLYDEDEATTAALAFREVTGMSVAIRPYYCPHQAH